MAWWVSRLKLDKMLPPLLCSLLVFTLVASGTADGPVRGVTQESFHMGEEAQKIGQVMREFSRRMIAVLREQSTLDDKEAYSMFRVIVSEALENVSALNPFEPGTMQKARDTVERILMQKLKRNSFENLELFGAFMKVIGDDITNIAQQFIDRGIDLCGNFVVKDGLSDFEKKYLNNCVNVFRVNSMKEWKE